MLKKLKIFLFTISVFIMVNCSTEKDAALNVGYHNMSARYNGYFNAGEIINQSVVTFQNGYKDDYTELLNLDIFPNEKEATGLFPDMDKAIEKCSKVIYRHSMPDPNVVSHKDEENCRWIDDNWFLIGKAHYYKREFDKAEERFNYIINEYSKATSKYASKIWLAKLHIQQGDYSKAKLQLISAKNDMDSFEEDKGSNFSSKIKQKLKLLKKSKYQRKKAKSAKKRNKSDEGEPEKFNNRLKKEYELTSATLNILEDNFKKAIENIEKAIEVTAKRKERARYQFVLAQLYQNLGNKTKANEYFQKVIKSNAAYEMRFYAKINKALSSDSNPIQLRKNLNKMLKDSKNDEYQDQVYYVLADIDLREGNRKGAIANLTKSAMFSVNNKRQKAKSYLKLADMHFEDKLYIQSQKYYDSCVKVMPKEHKDYKLIDSKAKSLLNLVENYEVYTVQDSLQKFAQLSEKDLEKELKSLLKEIKEKTRIKKINDKLRLEEQQRRLNMVNTVNSGNSKWYFYNQKSISRGFNDFKTSWGSSRLLEDDWRRSNKKQVNSFVDIGVDSTEVSVDSLTVDILREGLPLEPEDLKKSYDMQIEAMYNLGMIYKNQLDEEGEAIDYFQKILDKKKKHDKVLSAAYQLYLIEKANNSINKTKYENYIKTNFPNSDIAKLLSDPNYFLEKEKLAKKDILQYKKVFRMYEVGDYISAITASNDVIFKDPDNKYLNKYYILKAKAISKTGIGGVDAAVAPLNKLIEISPNSQEGIYAKQYLKSIKSNTNKANDPSTKYTFKSQDEHYFVIIIPNEKEGEINDTKIKVSNFNSSYFGGSSLKISTTLINEKSQVLLIKPFQNTNKIKVYENAYKSEPAKSLLNNISSSYEYLIISRSNYSLLLTAKHIEEYKAFYQKNY